MLLQLVHIAQSLISIYGLSISYFSVTNLQKYEEQSKKAAKWSGAAEHQLHKTRTTQASGALTVWRISIHAFFCAFCSAFFCAFFHACFSIMYCYTNH